jgi:hypothetical protein
MLFREQAQGWIAITQPMHAWLSGQLARVWGNERFGEVAPREEVCLGAEQHDVGHTAWEQAPALNPQTGLPYSFLELPRQVHLQMWSSAARLVLPQGRYAALLVSLHGTGLYERYDASKDTPENAQAVQDYLVQEREHACRSALCSLCNRGGSGAQPAPHSGLGCALAIYVFRQLADAVSAASSHSIERHDPDAHCPRW